MRKKEHKASPLEQYRRNIGSNETKLSKKYVEQMRAEGQRKRDRKSYFYSIFEYVILIFSCLLIGFAFYYFYLSRITEFASQVNEKQMRGII